MRKTKENAPNTLEIHNDFGHSEESPRIRQRWRCLKANGTQDELLLWIIGSLRMCTE